MSDADVARANELCVGTFPELIGLCFTEVSATVVRARMPVRPELFAPNGYLHGSVVTALAETACGFGTAASRPQELRSRFATIELACNFLGTAHDGWIACEATCSHAGRTTQVWDARVWREDDQRQIALLRLTQLLLGE